MPISRTSHAPYAELPVEARALLFILAQAAAPRFVAQPPKRSELTPVLEIIWDRNLLSLNDLTDPFRMTALLKMELSSLCYAGGAQ
jgi:hypothetical protein